MTVAGRWVGIDVGASALDVVELVDVAGRPAVGSARSVPVATMAGAVDGWAGATALAVDAPGELSGGTHRGEHPKFTRCCELAAGRDFGVWVPWATPVAAPPAGSWMDVGFRLWDALRAAGVEAMEVYPHGTFRLLAGGRLPSKRTAAGVRCRLGLLAGHVALPAEAGAWDHDTVDAASAALVAWWGRERAAAATHDGPGCDGSAMWFPPVELHR